MQTHPNAASAHSDALRMLQQHPEINVLVAFNEATPWGLCRLCRRWSGR